MKSLNTVHEVEFHIIETTFEVFVGNVPANFWRSEFDLFTVYSHNRLEVIQEIIERVVYLSTVFRIKSV